MSHSPASSDDEAPEVASFQSEKKAAKDRENAHHQFQTQEKEKRKVKNRRRDQALKERASLKKKQKVVASGSDDESEEEGLEVGGSRSRDDLEARMGRAVLEAYQELDEDEDGENKERVKTLEESLCSLRTRGAPRGAVPNCSTGEILRLAGCKGWKTTGGSRAGVGENVRL